MTVEPIVSSFDPSETAVRLRNELMAVREQIIIQAQIKMDAWRLAIAANDFLDDAANLAYYLALRSYDLRHLQKALSSLGLSSLGRSEGRVLPAIDAVLASLARIAGTNEIAYPDPVALTNGRATLEKRKIEIFGGVLPDPRHASW